MKIAYCIVQMWQLPSQNTAKLLSTAWHFSEFFLNFLLENIEGKKSKIASNHNFTDNKIWKKMHLKRPGSRDLGV